MIFTLNRDKSRRLIEGLTEAAIIVRGASVVMSNRAARNLLGVAIEGVDVRQVLPHPAVIQRLVRGGVTGPEEVEAAGFGGSRRHWLVRISPLGDGALLVRLIDRSEARAAEQMRVDFVANASHELRTPLASLTLLIETISGPARESAADRDRFLSMMQVQADRMRRLIDDLLSLSRIELDEHVPPSDRADLIDVAREVIDAIGPVAAERRVRLLFDAPQQPVRVVGERFQLTQVIQNLVDNALKYSPDGGEVRIEIAASGDREDVMATAGRRWDDAARIALLTPAAAANRSYAYVRVEDAGPGVPRHYLPRLGERFFRVEREQGQEKGGTGLGLAIVKHIVNRHRGGLLVESQPGRGTAFAAYVELAGEG